GGVVLPHELLRELRQSAVDAEPVLGHARADGPLAAQLEADRPTVLRAGRRAPVPLRPVRPLAPAEVEAAVGVAGPAEGPLVAGPAHRAGGRPRVVLR